MSSALATDTVVVPKVSLDVVSFVRSAREEHGLRHGDFLNYRRFCARRLHRIRRATKMTLGRGRFQSREVNANHGSSDVRTLHIVLVSAERAWAMAMQKKSDNEENDNYNTMKKLHMKRRLAKAIKYAHKLESLCVEVADEVTIMHAQAYATHLEAQLRFENELFVEARSLFVAARALYLSLAQDAKHVSEGTRKMCRSLAEEVEPNIRYCHLRAGGSDGAELQKLLATPASALPNLLAASSSSSASQRLHVSSMEDNNPAAKKEEESANDSQDNIVFRGTVVPLGKVVKLREAVFGIRASWSGLAKEGSSVLSALEDFVSSVSSALGILKTSSQHITGQQHQACEALLKLLSVEGTVLRNQAIANGLAGSKFDEVVVRVLSSFGVLPSASSPIMFNTAQRAAQEAKLLATSSSLVDDVLRSVEFVSKDSELVRILTCQAQLCDAERLVSVSERCACMLNQWSEAASYLEAARQILAREVVSDLSTSDADLQPILTLVQAQYAKVATLVDKRSVQLHALFKLSTVVSGEQQAASQARVVVAEDASKFPEDLSLLVAAGIPPRARPVPARPVFFDLAGESVQYPDLSERVEKLQKPQQKPAAGGGLFGFWRRG
eukprot:ANDGO_03892.mRNA.1 Signal recognition particle subunit SRP68